MIKFNVITPMARFNNIAKLKAMLEPMGVHWHIIVDDDCGFVIKFDESWISTHVCPNREAIFWARCNNSINWFIDTANIKENEYWCILNDDDGYEPEFFSKLVEYIEYAKEQGQDPSAIITAMARGDQVPPNTPIEKYHPTSYLPADPAYTRPGSVGVEQLILRGDLMKKYRLPLANDGDGQWVTKVASENMIMYTPGVDVWFNYFEPGRWNKE